MGVLDDGTIGHILKRGDRVVPIKPPTWVQREEQEQVQSPPKMPQIDPVEVAKKRQIEMSICTTEIERVSLLARYRREDSVG